MLKHYRDASYSANISFKEMDQEIYFNITETGKVGIQELRLSRAV